MDQAPIRVIYLPLEMFKTPLKALPNTCTWASMKCLEIRSFRTQWKNEKRCFLERVHSGITSGVQCSTTGKKLVCAHLRLCLVPPPCGRPNMVTLAWQEGVKLVHAHARHIEGRHMNMWPVRHPRLRHVGGVRPAATGRKHCQHF